LGADPLGVDGDGFPASTYATSSDIDRPLMEAIGAMASAELCCADRGQRRSNASMMDLVAVLSLHQWEAAERLLRDNPTLDQARGAAVGALHVMAKRDHLAAITGTPSDDGKYVPGPKEFGCHDGPGATSSRFARRSRCGDRSGVRS
jgi:hypothetical protein